MVSDRQVRLLRQKRMEKTTTLEAAAASALSDSARIHASMRSFATLIVADAESVTADGNGDIVKAGGAGCAIASVVKAYSETKVAAMVRMCEREILFIGMSLL